MAYNKSKYVEAAQKLLNQGKVAQAIAEYQQILKYEPRDQVTLMTVGELYIRQGETFQAIDYFERLAQIFVGDGFLTKAIAVYKRIAKLAPEEIRPLEKLADLYVQQGVMSEARPLFLQLAEIHLKANRQADAVGLLKKLLSAEPDNLRIQTRLADLYQAMGQTREAIDAYVSASQRALARGDQAECEKLADKALKLEPANLAAIIVKARSASSQGNWGQAAQFLEKVPDLEKGGEQAELLLDLYIKDQKWDEASALALRVFDADEKNFGLTQKVAEALLESGQGDKAMAIIARIRIPMIDAGEHETVGRLLNELAARMPGRIEPHEWLVDTYGRTSDSFRLPDALAHLGDALVENRNYERAKTVFEQLVDREPESDSAKRKLNDVLRKMGKMAPEEPPVPTTENLLAELPQAEAPKVRPGVVIPSMEPVAVTPPPPAPLVEPPLDEETQKFIAQSLTDVDLFASYGLTQKAIGLLEAILRRAPRHTPTLEKLLDFVLGAGDDRRTAELAAQLEQLHTERGDARSAERFGELRRRFQRAAGLSDADLAGTSPAATADETPEFAIEQPQAETPEISASQPAAAATDSDEVDLSDEWASLLAEQKPAVEPADAPAEVEISMDPAETDQPLFSEAAKAHEPPPITPPEDSPVVAEFEVSIESPGEARETVELSSFELPGAEAPVAEPSHPEPAGTVLNENPFAEISAELPSGIESGEPQPAAPEEVKLEEVAAATTAPSEPAAPKPADEKPKSAEPEFEVEQDYELVLEPEALVPAHDQKPPETPQKVPATPNAAPPASGFASDQFLADLANEIDELGIDQLSPAYSTPDVPQAAAPAKSASPSAVPGEHAPLQEVFDDFRAELGEMGVEDEDLETHYNLGIAFREMGLLEEAISEFQKVAKATDRGKPFRYAMQCCTLLGLAFMEKGQPSIAAIWYERALLTPGIDSESILALRYDLGVAQESAGEPAAALKSFSQVYAMNIDYRDVAERISALQKPIR